MLLTTIKNFINAIEKNENLYNLEFLAKEYIEMHKDKCDKCQKYRVECAFSPHCTDRKHLNILIQLNTSKNDRIFPNYCYSLYVKNINDLFKDKVTLTSTSDSWIYLKDFFTIFKKELKKSKKKDDRSLFMDLFKAWKQAKIPVLLENGHEKKDEFTFMLKNVAFRIKFSTGVIIVDVNNRTCHSDEELENYLHLLRAYYNLDSHVEFIKDTRTLWYMKFIFTGENVDRIKEKLPKYSHYYNMYEHEGGLEITIEVKTSVHDYSERKIQNYKNLRKIFKLFCEESDTSITQEGK